MGKQLTAFELELLEAVVAVQGLWRCGGTPDEEEEGWAWAWGVVEHLHETRGLDHYHLPQPGLCSAGVRGLQRLGRKGYLEWRRIPGVGEKERRPVVVDEWRLTPLGEEALGRR